MGRIPLFALVLVVAAPALARAEAPLVRERDGFTCRAGTENWTAQQVIQERIAALVAGDMNRVMCTYAVDAVVIMPGTVIRGRPAIERGFIGFFQLFGGSVPIFDSMDFANGVALVTFHISGPVFSIPDGADTYVIKNGRIQEHTVHDVLAPTP